MSGIYIPGVEMPTDCENCIFCDGDACLMHKPNEYRSWPEEYKNCPLFPVPDHGRLIDGDEALAEAKRLSGPFTGDGWDNWGVYALIERQKTIIPADPADKEGEG